MHVNKQKALTNLYLSEKVSALNVALFSQHITPSFLIDVIEYRHSASLPPLPYCSKEAVEAFNQHLEDNGIYLDSQPYAVTKKLALDLPKPWLLDATTCLARTNDWYSALVQYQAHDLANNFENVAQFQEHITAVAYMFTVLLWATIKTALLILVMAVSWIIPLPGTGPVANYYLYPYLLTALDNLTSSTCLIKPELSSLITRTYGTCFTTTPDDTLQTACERAIERLKFMDEDSANQKGALLQTLWNTIQDDNESENELQVKLNQPYYVWYQKQMHHLSFFEVAAMKRQRSDRFNLNEPKSMLRFFFDKRETTTHRQLDLVQHAQANRTPRQ